MYEAHMSPAPRRSSAIRRFERSDAIEIRDGITFDFYTGLPHVLFISNGVLTIAWSDCNIFVRFLWCPTINYSASFTPLAGPPIVSSQGGQPQEKVGSNITLPCVYTANPTVRITKWHFREFITGSSSLILMGDTSGHYSVERNSLTVYNLTAADGGLYTCNVTNQCGSDQTTYHVIIIGKLYTNPILWPPMSSVCYKNYYILHTFFILSDHWATTTRQLHYPKICTTVIL